MSHRLERYGSEMTTMDECACAVTASPHRGSLRARAALRALLLTVSLGLLLAMMAASSARAADRHEFLSAITSVPATAPDGGGSLTNVEKLTVASGLVYATAETEQGQSGFSIDGFDESSGEFKRQFSLPAPLTTEVELASQSIGGEEHLYSAGEEGTKTGKTGKLVVLGSAGEPLGEWTGSDTPAGSFDYGTASQLDDGIKDIATDQSSSPLDWAAGDVFVAVRGQAVIDIFKPQAGGGESYVTQLVGSGVGGADPGVSFEGPDYIAVSSVNGDLLVAGEQKVAMFEPAGSDEYRFVRALADRGARRITGVAVDNGEGPFAGEIYLAAAGTSIGEQAEVDQFSAEGKYEGRLTGTSPTSSFESVEAVTISPVSHKIYVATERLNRLSEGREAAIDVFGPSVVLPDVAVTAPSGLRPRGVTLTGTVNPDDGGEVTKCEFQLGTSPQYGQRLPCDPQAIANGAGAVAVEAVVDELKPTTTYYYRLVAANRNGENTGQGAEDEGQLTTPGPTLASQWTASADESSAVVDAEINPNGSPTGYFMQYGLSAGYGAQTPGVALGAGTGVQRVAIHLQGLQPGSTYHYRVVAVGEAGGESVEVAGQDETFTTASVPGSSFALPDHRIWEVVSPAAKYGAGIETFGPEGGIVQAAANGDAITYLATGPIVEQPAGNRDLEFTQVLSARGAAGWVTQDLNAPNSAVFPLKNLHPSEYALFSEDLALAGLEPRGPTPLAPAQSPGETPEQSVYLRDTDAQPQGEEQSSYDQAKANGQTVGNAGFLPLLDAANVLTGATFGYYPIPNEGWPEIAGATPNMSSVIVSSPQDLTSDAPAPEKNGDDNLYEWTASKPPAEQLQLVSILEDGEAAGGGKTGEVASLGRSGGGSGLGIVLARHAVSDDGSVVVWSTNSENPKLYARDTQSEESVRVDKAQGVSEPPPAGAVRYQDASSNGSRIFFTSGRRLTPDSHATKPRPDLYVFELSRESGTLEGKLTDLTAGTTDGLGADVLGTIPGANEEGTVVYFVANGRFSGSGPDGECNDQGNAGRGLPGESCDLYVVRDVQGSWQQPQLVTELTGSDSPDWSSAGENPQYLSSRVSPNGRFLAFMSNGQPTGYDNHDAAKPAESDEEVYLFDLDTGKLACASCNPSGARPHGFYDQPGGAGARPLVDSRSVWEQRTLAGIVPGWSGATATGSVHQPRYLSDEGRVFFDSPDRLVPADSNETEDVYEYEPTGVGSCAAGGDTVASVYKAPRAYAGEDGAGEEPAGCVSLISSGTSSQESVFLDAGEGGGDVFFMTAAPLVAQDQDSAFDIYDAHECVGGEPCGSGAANAAPPCTNAESCRAAPKPQPAVYGPPASETFSGGGSVVSAPPGKAATVPRRAHTRCAKGHKRRKGKCVASKAKPKSKAGRKAAKAGRANANARGER